MVEADSSSFGIIAARKEYEEDRIDLPRIDQASVKSNFARPRIKTIQLNQELFLKYNPADPKKPKTALCTQSSNTVTSS